ncbi:MAG TPA: hypothetical protein VGM03_00070 [Phycisphaerae bacterium]
MADTAGLTPFGPDDRFLRRIRFPDHLKRGIVYWRAFKEKDDVPTLSYTYQDASLRSDPALDAYREYFSRALGGDLPGLLWLSWRALAQQVRPPLPPRHDPDASDPVYGHLHCVTDAPRDKIRMELLAKLVNDRDLGGVLREVVRRTVTG